MTPIANLDVSELDFKSWLQFFFDRPLIVAGASFTEQFCADAVSFRSAQPRRSPLMPGT